MRASIGALMVILLLARSGFGAESLMFSEDEVAALGGAVPEEETDALAMPPPAPAVHLAAIMPSGGGKWLARVGESWLAEGDSLGDLRVESIEAQSVRFLWSGEPRATRFSLQPNQSIDLATGVLREGR